MAPIMKKIHHSLLQVLNSAGLTIMAELLAGTGLDQDLDQGKRPAYNLKRGTG